MDPGTDWVPSEGKYALDFQGSPADKQRADIQLFASNARFTVTCWCKLSATGAVNLIGATNSAFTRSQFYLRLGANSGFTDDSGSYYEVTMPPVSVGVLTFISLSYDGATLTSWINGSVHATASHAAVPWTTSATLAIGRGGEYDGQYFNGLLDDLRVYNRVLTPSEIRTLSFRRGIAYETQRRTRAYVAGGGPAGLSIPIAAYHYNHNLAS